MSITSASIVESSSNGNTIISRNITSRLPVPPSILCNYVPVYSWIPMVSKENTMESKTKETISFANVPESRKRSRDQEEKNKKVQIRKIIDNEEKIYKETTGKNIRIKQDLNVPITYQNVGGISNTKYRKIGYKANLQNKIKNQKHRLEKNIHDANIARLTAMEKIDKLNNYVQQAADAKTRLLILEQCHENIQFSLDTDDEDTD